MACNWLISLIWFLFAYVVMTPLAKPIFRSQSPCFDRYLKKLIYHQFWGDKKNEKWAGTIVKTLDEMYNPGWVQGPRSLTLILFLRFEGPIQLWAKCQNHPIEADRICWFVYVALHTKFNVRAMLYFSMRCLHVMFFP